MAFSGLGVWVDTSRRIPAGNMAADEAMLALASRPTLRVYGWVGPAVTFGYALRCRDALALAGARPIMRRWTGGGIVFHGTDTTISLAVPGGHPLAALPPPEFYRKIHEMVLGVLLSFVPDARLADVEDCLPGQACFEAPALHDILCGKRKICGGALRRGKEGILYQGSILCEVPHGDLARALSGCGDEHVAGDALEELAASLEAEKYSTDRWVRRR